MGKKRITKEQISKDIEETVARKYGNDSKSGRK
jgi:hypothetical protein